jgi:3-hydroxybutyryl-CoA dehydrogenase
MKNITVIGSGTMGNGIAHVFAQFGYSVALLILANLHYKKLWQLLQKTLTDKWQKVLLLKPIKQRL